MELRAGLARARLEVDSRRHRHRRQRLFPAAGGSGRLRRPAESLLQRVAGRIDGEFPIRSNSGWPPTRTRIRWKSSRVRRRSISTLKITFASPPGRCSGAAGQSRFSSGLAAVGPRGVFRRAVAALRAADASRGCCCSRRPTRSAPSSSCGGNRAASSAANCASRPRPRTPNRSSRFESLSLAEIVRLTNKHSNNLMARHLLLTLGKERYGDPATLEKGAAAMAEWGRERGFDLQGMDIDNGSGLVAQHAYHACCRWRRS